MFNECFKLFFKLIDFSIHTQIAFQDLFFNHKGNHIDKTLFINSTPSSVNKPSFLDYASLIAITAFNIFGLHSPMRTALFWRTSSNKNLWASWASSSPWSGKASKNLFTWAASCVCLRERIARETYAFSVTGCCNSDFPSGFERICSIAYIAWGTRPLKVY